MNDNCTCPVCGAPYKFYSMTVKEQDLCPACVAARNRALERPTPEQEAARAQKRREAFG